MAHTPDVSVLCCAFWSHLLARSTPRPHVPHKSETRVSLPSRKLLRRTKTTKRPTGTRMEVKNYNNLKKKSIMLKTSPKCFHSSVALVNSWTTGCCACFGWMGDCGSLPRGRQTETSQLCYRWREWSSASVRLPDTSAFTLTTQGSLQHPGDITFLIKACLFILSFSISSSLLNIQEERHGGGIFRGCCTIINVSQRFWCMVDEMLTNITPAWMSACLHMIQIIRNITDHVHCMCTWILSAERLSLILFHGTRK